MDAWVTGSSSSINVPMPAPGRHRAPGGTTVVHGQPAAEVLGEWMRASGDGPVVLVTTRSLAGPGSLAARLRESLGARCVDTVDDLPAHTPRLAVVRLAARLRATLDGWPGRLLIVGLGGGSVCDAIKAARWCLGNGISDAPAMDRLLEPGADAPVARSAMVPTTLSAAEHTAVAGVTDERGPRKEVLRHPGLQPELVVLDARMTLDTPARLWCGTGLRAVDHAVETWCSSAPHPCADALALHALRLLVPGLARSVAAPDDLDARLSCLVAAWLSVLGSVQGVPLGASHGIGHALGGTAGMAHGETSSVMLPHVLRFNDPVNGARQAFLAQAVAGTGAVLAQVVAALVQTLGLPARLRDAGVPRGLLAAVAREAVADPLVPLNPRPIEGEAGILALLEAAW